MWDVVVGDLFQHYRAVKKVLTIENGLGAITTINTLLKKEDNRCAALTMLGKTVELCLDILTDKCDHGVLRELRATLDSVCPLSVVSEACSASLVLQAHPVHYTILYYTI